MLALDFGGSKIAAALSGLDGRVRHQRVVATDAALGAAANLELGLALARSVLDSPAADGGGTTGSAGLELVAAAACTFGIPRDHGVDLSPAIPGWDRLPLRHLLEEAFGLPFVVLTDVKAAAAAEAASGALAGCSSGIYLNLGTGLAAAIVHDGAVVTGAHGASGEIGYNLRAAGDVWGAARPGPPMLEDVVSGMGLWNTAQISAVDLFERRGDPEADEVIDRFVRELAFHLVNLAIAVDPERIAVGGGIVRAFEVLRGPLAAALEAHVPYPPELVVGAFPDDAPLRGAVQAALRSTAGSADGAAGSAGAVATTVRAGRSR